MAGARQIVEPPAFTPLPYGLWDAVEQRPADSPHWRNGITWTDRCPAGDTTYDECISVTGTGAPPEPAAKTANVEQTTRGATPITVYARFDCTMVGLSDAERVAADSLARVEALQLEAAFWTGTAGGQNVVFPHLAADTEVLDGQDIVLQTVASPVVTGADVVHAMGALEAELADCYGGQGLIHVPPQALPTLTAWKQALKGDDGRLYSPAGHLIVAGSGYTGTSPAGAAPAAGTAWIYATGKAFGYRSEVYLSNVRDSLDRSSNTAKMLAERTYVLAFECCHLAAHIVLGVPTE